MISDSRVENGILIIENIPYLKAQMFATRTDFKKVVVGDGVGFFEEEVFAECPALEEVVLPEGLINIGVAAFTSDENLTLVNVPSSVKSIEEGAFLFCENLRHISLPDGLEHIADLAFQSTGLEEITIPASCQSIGEEAFFECVNLVEANVLGPDTQIGINAFASSYNLIRGYMAPGYPTESSAVSELLFSLLWASCPDRHSAETSARAIKYISDNESLVFERILKYNNIPAMNGIAEKRIFSPSSIDKYVKLSADEGLTEITALLLKSKGTNRFSEGDFEL